MRSRGFWDLNPEDLETFHQYSPFQILQLYQIKCGIGKEKKKLMNLRKEKEGHPNISFARLDSKLYLLR